MVYPLFSFAKFMRNKLITIICLIFFFTIGCKESPTKHFRVDVSKIDLKPDIFRYEKNLLEVKNFEDLKKLSQEEPYITWIYINYIMPKTMKFYDFTEEEKINDLYEYIKNPTQIKLNKYCIKQFENFKPFEKQFEDAMKRITYHFPEDTVSKVYTFTSSMEYGGVFVEDDKIFLVGLDMFLGADFDGYKVLSPERFPKYRVQKMTPENLVPLTVRGYAVYKAGNSVGNAFIDEAIYEGKILYVMDALFPKLADSVKINYTKEQFQWASQNEKNIWTYLIDQDLIFNNDRNLMSKTFFNDGPFTSPLGPESAPRLGAFIGWQIIRSYMSKNPNVSVQDLMKETDHQKIFRLSKYRP